VVRRVRPLAHQRDEQGGKLLTVAVALLQALNDLPARPDEAPRAVAGRPPLRPRRRRPDHLLVPTNDHVVLALVGFDKKAIGDVFYASAAARGEALVDAWLRQKGSSHD
jgi:hypothetical protein